MDFSNFYHIISISSLKYWLETLPFLLQSWRRKVLLKDQKLWESTVKNLPQVYPEVLDLLHGVTADNTQITVRQRVGIDKLLRTLMPWRKGPFMLYRINIDSEWRSDWKWDRVVKHISPLSGRTVLDVGCGNGYYMWRMLAHCSALVVGVDPCPLFLYQFEAVRKLLGNDQRVHLIPLKIEQLPSLEAFDTVFSMGVLCHRRSPLDHLYQLRSQLVKGGELVLETLVIEGDDQTVLMPKNRYAKMKNVYFLPSSKALQCWIERCGFDNVRIVDHSITTVDEQRCTNWMLGKSLSEFLDLTDKTKTIEGYPAPQRAIVIATAVS
ncbi:tRNA 5-methoxyuridine(34)/uridine 5-oxyacetic acid(34) synthase CmoB [Candidatus Erwinia haradaeae]|uniref:tRNA U34 carboxymethyltransferase n=1 Tax=Candidatus Erwinia haradaeae TaxID=1922217 RepID=A0A451D2V1_9GAMM|nr:tRNA 5-methoxyuridine(34)/uridine 5-oxyacetic acid(34) synthase CmoB [Candidatus Erwinia haradaeae]VFP79983.1 tRNA U34 carboxymethyltransferase [Candidatus Erwinia haradaeae]